MSDRKVINELNEQALMKSSQKARDTAIIRKLNEIARAINTDIVWKDKVEAERAIEQVYDDLPLSVTAEMVEEEYTEAMTELGLE